jgi:hypothetical protein
MACAVAVSDMRLPNDHAHCVSACRRCCSCLFPELQLTSSGSTPCTLQTSAGKGVLARPDLVSAAAQQLRDVQPDQTEQNAEADSTGVPVPRWLVVMLNCVMLGGVAATVSVALLSMRRSSSFGSKSKNHSNAMADILERAGKRRGWTEARTERVLHLIGVQRSSKPLAKGSAPTCTLDPKPAPDMDEIGLEKVTRHPHVRHTANLATRPGLATRPAIQPEHGERIPYPNLAGPEPGRRMMQRSATAAASRPCNQELEACAGCEHRMHRKICACAAHSPGRRFEVALQR